MMKVYILFFLLLIYYCNGSSLPHRLRCADKACNENVSVARILQHTEALYGDLKVLKKSVKVNIKGKHVDINDSLWLVEFDGLKGFVDFSLLKENSLSVVHDLEIVDNPYYKPQIINDSDETESFEDKTESKLFSKRDLIKDESPEDHSDNTESTESIDNVKKNEINNDDTLISGSKKHSSFLESQQSSTDIHSNETNKNISRINDDSDKSKSETNSLDKNKVHENDNKSEKNVESTDKVANVLVNNNDEISISGTKQDTKIEGKEALKVYPMEFNSDKEANEKPNKSSDEKDNNLKEESKHDVIYMNVKSETSGDLFTTKSEILDNKIDNEITKKEYPAVTEIKNDEISEKIQLLEYAKKEVQENASTDNRNETVEEMTDTNKESSSYSKKETIKNESTNKDFEKSEYSHEPMIGKENISDNVIVSKEVKNDSSDITEKSDNSGVFHSSSTDKTGIVTKDFPKYIDKIPSEKTNQSDRSHLSIKERNDLSPKEVEETSNEPESLLVDKKETFNNDIPNEVDVGLSKETFVNDKSDRTISDEKELSSKEVQKPYAAIKTTVEQSKQILIEKKEAFIEGDQSLFNNSDQVHSNDILKSEKLHQQVEANSSEERDMPRINGAPTTITDSPIDITKDMRNIIENSSESDANHLDKIVNKDAINNNQIDAVQKNDLSVNEDQKESKDEGVPAGSKPLLREDNNDSNILNKTEEDSKNKVIENSSTIDPDFIPENQSSGSGTPANSIRTPIDSTSKESSIVNETPETLEVKEDDLNKGSDPWLIVSERNSAQSTEEHLRQLRSPLLTALVKMEQCLQSTVQSVISRSGMESSIYLTRFVHNWLCMSLNSFVLILSLLLTIVIAVYTPKMFRLSRDWKLECDQQRQLISDLTVKLQTTEDVREKLSIQNHSFEKMIDQYKGRVTEIQEDAREKKRTIQADWERMKKTNDSKIEKLSHDLDTRTQQGLALQEAIVARDMEIERLQEDRRTREHQMSEELSLMDETIKGLRDKVLEMEELREELRKVVTENTALRNEVVELTGSVRDGHDRINKLNSAFEGLAMFEGLDEDECRERVRRCLDYNETRAEISAMEAEVSRMAVLLDEARRRMVELETSNSEWQRSSEESKAEEERATKDREAAELRLKVLTEYFQDKEMELQRSLGHESVEKSQSVERAEALRVQLEALEAENNGLRGTVERLRTEVRHSQSFAADCKSEASNQVATMAANVGQMERELLREREETRQLRARLSYYVGPSPRSTVMPSGGKDRPSSRQSDGPPQQPPPPPIFPLSLLQHSIPQRSPFSGRASVNSLSKKSNNS